MKILKLLVFAVLFVAGREAVAQNILVHNNTMDNMNVTFNFKAPCAPVATSTPGPGNSINPFNPACGLLSFTVTFVDKTCMPPQTVNFTVNFTTNPTHYTYTRCDGTIVNFDIHYNGMDYILDING